MDLFAVILAGGSGTRFWPASRAARPKQFLPVAGEEPLLAQTLARLAGLVSPERVLVVTAAAQAPLVRECLPALPAENVLVEPEPRNTAPAVALAALELERRTPGAVHAVLAADHVISPAESFRRTLASAARRAAAGGELVTLGIRPTHPATGYGYVRVGEREDDVDGIPVHRVERFVEKPDRATAEGFVRSGRFLWNSGIFVWSGRAVLAGLERHAPDVIGPLRAARGPEAVAAAYRSIAPQPIDKALLERAENVLVLPIDYLWSDVGSWSALADLVPPDASGSWPVLSRGARLVAEDSSGCVVYAEGDELVALLGVHDLVVVRAGDATLVCPRDRAEDVRLVVERVRRESPGQL